MVKIRCRRCNEKLKKSFDFCPSCGTRVLDSSQDSKDYGMLGKNDFLGTQDMKLPFGFNKIFNNLVKQLEKQMNSEDFGAQGMPRGFKVQISTGRPQQTRQMIERKPMRQDDNKEEFLSDHEKDRRMNLPKVNAESKMKRLGDKIIYEIEAPGVIQRKDVLVTKLATGLEIKAYTKDKCYVKFIPLTVEVINCNVKKDKVFVELKV